MSNRVFLKCSVPYIDILQLLLSVLLTVHLLNDCRDVYYVYIMQRVYIMQYTTKSFTKQLLIYGKRCSRQLYMYFFLVIIFYSFIFYQRCCAIIISNLHISAFFFIHLAQILFINCGWRHGVSCLFC